MVSTPTLYEVLSCPPTATLHDLKRAYQRAALDCHPDRSPEDAEVRCKTVLPCFSRWNGHTVLLPWGDCSQQLTGVPGVIVCYCSLKANERFRRIQEAWEVLRDPSLRSDYDRELAGGRYSFQRYIPALRTAVVTHYAADRLQNEKGAAVVSSRRRSPCRTWITRRRTISTPTLAGVASSIRYVVAHAAGVAYIKQIE